MVKPQAISGERMEGSSKEAEGKDSDTEREQPYSGKEITPKQSEGAPPTDEIDAERYPRWKRGRWCPRAATPSLTLYAPTYPTMLLWF